MLNQGKPKRGRKFGLYPQQHLRIACDLQELQGIHEVMPDTRLRAVTLLAQPTIVEVLAAIERLALELPGAERDQEIVSLAREVLTALKGNDNDGK